MPSPSGPLGGLRLHVVTEPDARSGAVYLWFDVGAADEGPAEHGAAHFLEHMLFKDTETLEIGAAAACIEGLGGDLNAWTSADELVLHAVVPAEDTPTAIDVLLEMASRPRLRGEEMERERQVILDEIRGYADDTEALASDALMANLFAGHAYGRPVLGTERSVGALQPEQLVAFHRRHVHPGRAILAVRSPWPAEAVRERLAPVLERWHLGEARRPIRAPGKPTPRAKRLAVAHGGATVHLGVRCPGHGHADLPALEVLATCLGQGAASLLPEALELETGVASGAWAAVSPQRAGGTLELGFQVGRTEEAVPMALDVLDRVVADGIDGERVARAIDGLACDQRFARETVDGRTADDVTNLALHGDVRFGEAHRQRLAAVRPEDVHAVARAVLSSEHRALVVVDRQITPKQVQRWHRRRASPPPPRRTDPVVMDLHGLTAVLLPDGSPLGAVTVRLAGGQLLEPGRATGLAQAWSRAVLRGAGAWDASAFAARTDALAMVLDGHGGRGHLGLYASLPADRLLAGLALVEATLLEPHFDAVDVDHVVEELLDDEAAQHDRAAQVAQDALRHALFPGHPWRRPSLGTPATIERIRAGTLGKLHKRSVVRQNVVVVVVGGSAEGALRDRLEALANALPEGPAPSLPIPARPPGPVPRRTGGQTQGAVAMGVRVGAGDPGRRRQLAVLAALLDSQSGRLFMELREELGLAYGVWAGADATPGVPIGAFTLGLTVDPVRAEEASDALARSWRQLLHDGPDVEELARATRMVAGHAALARERVSGRARALLQHVVGGQPWSIDAMRDELLRIDRAALRPLLDELASAPSRVAVVLPEDP